MGIRFLNQVSSSPYSCTIEAISTSSVTGGSDFTAMQLNTVVSDINGMYNGSGGIVIPKNGLYLITLFVNNNTSTSSKIRGYIYINNTYSSSLITPYSLTDAWCKVDRTFTLRLNKGDVITAKMLSTETISSHDFSRIDILEMT